MLNNDVLAMSGLDQQEVRRLAEAERDCQRSAALHEANPRVWINLSSIAALVGRSGPAAIIFNDGYAAAQRGISALTETVEDRI